MFWRRFWSDGHDGGGQTDARAAMVRSQLAERGIHDVRVLGVMRELPRHLFIAESGRGAAYGDHALPIECGQTISQPYMVALMTQELRLAGTERVLEIGTGSGYQAAVLGRLAGRVWSVERIPELAETARRRLAGLGLDNVEVVVGDGTLGLPAHAPYDRILVTAGGPVVPEPLLAQLAPGGRLLAPVGPERRQMLTAVDRREDGRLVRSELCPCVFVDLVGRHGRRQAEG